MLLNERLLVLLRLKVGILGIVVVGILGIVVLALLAIGGYKIIFPKESIVMEDFASAVPENLTGMLLLSASTASPSNQDENGLLSFTIDAATGLGQYLPFNELINGPALTLQYSFSNNASLATFLGIPIVDNISEQQITPSIYSANLTEATNLEELTKAMREASVVSTPTSNDYFREFPAISLNRTIAYSSLNKEVFEKQKNNLPVLPAENWAIYTTDSSVEQPVTRGLKPKWINGETFAYLKNDGVYTYNTLTKIEKRIWELYFKPNISTGFDISDDATLAVITNPKDSFMTVTQILDWDTPSLKKEKKVSTSATSPVLAPNNAYVAMFTGIQDDTTGEKFTQISYYDLTSKSFLEQIVLFTAKEITGLYLTDWK